ncbi:helix-turn-helix transcriptional regulator [Candidatus Woesearchaeota archaeon]|nr:helix-turn-helix transcriptional regulator [Candidatus Woesearchaeota archaeon]
MPDEPFMLVSLEEAKAKKLAQVLSNETCTKLLNYLAKQGEATESEIAKKLKLPLSTVHYNLKQLVEAKLVLADEYHYSEKGREVNHYKLANKYIIIAPHEDTSGFMDKLKTFLPVTLITVATAAVLKVLSVINGTGFKVASADSIQAAPMAARTFEEEAMKEVPGILPGGCVVEPTPFFSNPLILAFLVGGLFAIGLLILIAYIRHKKKK